MIKGGAGAAQYMMAVAGSGHQQHAQGGEAGHVLAYDGGVARSYVGGRRRRKTSRRPRKSRRYGRSRRYRGGTTLTDLAVPAALYFATRFGTRRPSARTARRTRNRRR
jgi:hypothetical protein